ncbi:hypothetical protein B5C34_08445 [Pacificimonas flava]|uniref:histidine kinase n=2 Tax=Pacificimonas TaxID=1960290 RepID=A0A219B534_9SPHN|nr:MULTISPECIES: histidine kinase dimerization/phosphoacceptor domain -containing protein [Pacificimonas]MBZ6379308.1 ATP-binding protein [Pacificimonas aurantium]OWV33485.1 hypothetical protein B5C34_08445 [Pacificimonas flava]
MSWERRLGELDLPDRFAPAIPRPVTMIGVALACTILAFAARWLVDQVLPAAGPFALTVPFVLAASLFARAFAGVLTQTFCALYAWYFVLPASGSFAFAVPSDGPRVVVNVLAGFAVVALAEVFRSAVRRAVAERDDALERRDLYLHEFDHRVKNNFAMVASLLDVQRRQFAEDDPAHEALSVAAGRVDLIARAHESLYRGDGLPTLVDMRDCLGELCGTLSHSLNLPGGVNIACQAETAWLPRDRAIAIGLIVNELATNAAKHAFAGRDSGRVDIAFHRRKGGYCLIVEDDGVGMASKEGEPPLSRHGGLGQRLIDAFAMQARGKLTRDTDGPGTRFVFELDGAEEKE